MLLTTLFLSAALSQEARELAPGDFVVEKGAGKVAVTSVMIPKSIGIDPSFRVCRVSIDWTGDAWSPRVQDGCHPNLVEAVEEAARGWVLDVEAPGRPTELMEYWVVFPAKRGGDVRLFVRQAWDAELRLIPEWIVPLQFGVKARVFPEFPPEAVGQDTEITQCDVHLDISTSGVPTNLHISACDEVFHKPTEDALRRWRFISPELDGIPFSSGANLGVQFVRDYDVEEGDPPGHAEVTLPPDLDLGARTQDRLEEAPVEERPSPPEPTWPALFVMDHKSYAEVGVYDIRWPEPVTGDRDLTCDVLFQVNSKRQVWAWAEDCDEAVFDATETATNAWNLKHGEIEKGERFARFRGTLLYPADGSHVQLLLPEDDVRSPLRDLPDNVHSYVSARALKRVPPRLPRGFASEVLETEVVCEFEVRVDRGGRPQSIKARECPASYEPYAVKAIEKWRWIAAESGGKAVSSSAVVRLRFNQPEGAGG